MSSLTEAEIDALFLEEDEVPDTALFLSEDSEMPSAAVKPAETFSPFTTLPPELRNLVYSQYFSEYFASNPSIKINAHGEIVKPPLTYVSTEIRKETDGYFTTYLNTKSRSNTLTIIAQIGNYNLLPLPKRLLALSAQLDTPYRTLFRRTSTTFHGAPSFPNLQRYMTVYLDDPTLYFSCKDSCASLHAVMTTWKNYHYARTENDGVWTWRGNSIKWRYVAQEFLEETKTLNLSPGRVGGGSSGDDLDDKAVAKVVFEVMANWHVILAEELGEKGVKRWMGCELDKIRARHTNMADVVYDFQMRLSGWTGWLE